jgi:hypothetical protein
MGAYISDEAVSRQAYFSKRFRKNSLFLITLSRRMVVLIFRSKLCCNVYCPVQRLVVFAGCGLSESTSLGVDEMKSAFNFIELQHVACIR